ncbi:amino acid adenylation domain-containing protein [Streptomyces rectiverticillatus]|uniref:amino acid adenylation domain-containing protein n=1 Tax=Streptomyces rectiverticillatus TaxID=173860 RepID=UPI0015C36235|nr:amino acid adenylation domain-containing protein [Streptomyces rectiverticillatus]QLE74793.1 amino acid adenylation domain-containing protein [Streptomyces rectiverticillatus]
MTAWQDADVQQDTGRAVPVRAELPLAPGTVDRANALALRRTQDADTRTSVLEYVILHAEQAPDRIAVTEGERTLTYRELLERVAVMRDALHSRGVRAGDVVAAVGPRSTGTPVVFLALESLGASYLPIDLGWPEVRVRDVLNRSRAALLLDYSGTGTGTATGTGNAGEAGDASSTARAATAAAAAEGTPTLRPPAEGAPGPAAPLPRNTADRSRETRYTIFTSGTTGRPKGATVEHQGMLNHLWAKVADLSLGPGDVVAFTAPLVFDISIWQMLCPLLAGGRLVVVDDGAMRFPRWLVGTLDTAGVTVVELVPTVVGWLVDEARRLGGGLLQQLRWLLSTGEELHPAVAARVLDGLPHVAVVNAYGPTECSDDVTHHLVTSADLARPRLPVGSPVVNTALYLLVHGADGTWRAAGPGESGELFVGGTGVGLGYLNDPATTDRAFFRDPFDPASATGRLYRTGDLARFDEGLVHYLGRSDRQVKVAGVRMELDEIEAVLSRHPAVEKCAVTVSGEGDLAELVAHYCLRSPAEPEALEETLGAALPLPMVPRRWREWEALPLTHNGKIDHRSLQAAAATPRKEAR